MSMTTTEAQLLAGTPPLDRARGYVPHMCPSPSVDSRFELTDPLSESPGPLLSRWFEEAHATALIRNPDAMALATIDAEGCPQVRFVLCRGFEERKARFTFFTHYDSPKGRDLLREAQASAAFYWDPLGLQVRVTGSVQKAPEGVSDAYFAGRGRHSQISAWASRQSTQVESRAELDRIHAEQADTLEREHGSKRLPRPPKWGGFVLEANRIELWAEGEGRVHDRARWSRCTDTPDGKSCWSVARLQP